MGATMTSAMGLDNATFFMEKRGQECGDVQFLRELTENSIEAKQGAGRTDKEIRWDYDEYLHEATSLLKLCITDKGDGRAMVGNPPLVDH